MLQLLPTALSVSNRVDQLWKAYEWNESKHKESKFPSFNKPDNKSSNKCGYKLYNSSYFLSNCFLNYKGITVNDPSILLKKKELDCTHFEILEVNFPVPTKS